MISATIGRGTVEFIFDPLCQSLDSPYWIPFSKMALDKASHFAIRVLNSYTKEVETVWVEERLFTNQMSSLKRQSKEN